MTEEEVRELYVRLVFLYKSAIDTLLTKSIDTDLATVAKEKCYARHKFFYNHLYFRQVPSPYLENIKKDRRYRQIVKHQNYNPRIIEFVCDPRQTEQVKSFQYSDFIIHSLNNPEQIWKDEYERRLASTDRILLTTLYSMTNTTIPIKMVRKCYDHRLSLISGIDTSINYFDQAVHRLSNSMIKIVDVKGVTMLSAANPSVNDFIRGCLQNNSLEQKKIVSSCLSIIQLKRLLNETAYCIKLECIFSNKTILSFVFESEQQKAILSRIIVRNTKY